MFAGNTPVNEQLFIYEGFSPNPELEQIVINSAGNQVFQVALFDILVSVVITDPDLVVHFLHQIALAMDGFVFRSRINQSSIPKAENAEKDFLAYYHEILQKVSDTLEIPAAQSLTRIAEEVNRDHNH